MRVCRFQDTFLNDITRLINQHTAQIAPGFVFHPGQTKRLIYQSGVTWDFYYPQSVISAGREHIYCVLEKGRVQAAAHWQIFGAQCVLLWLVANPTRPEACQMLLQVCLRDATRQKATAIITSRHHTGAGWFGLPDTWPHLIDGLRAAGFRETNRWLWLSARLSEILSVTVPEDATIETEHITWQKEPEKRAWGLALVQDDRCLASCDVWDFPPLFDNCAAAQDAVLLEVIEVDASLRRGGLATRLIQQQMRYHQQRGKSRVFATTETDNTAARWLCQRLGFVEECICTEFVYHLTA